MTTHRPIDRAQRWLWGICAAAFLTGVGVAWHHLGNADPAPAPTAIIPASNVDQLALDHPFPTRPDPDDVPGDMLFSLYKEDPRLEAKSLAEEIHPLSFGLSDPWVVKLLAEKLPNVNHAFAFRLRGQIKFTAPVTHLHIRSDNGYRITFRDSEGHEAHMDDWSDSVTENFYFQVTAMPGCYELEIDFSNIQGNAYFDLWSEEKDIRLYPAAATKP